MNIQLKLGSCMFVSGPSSSGKTDFILQIIKNAKDLFDHPPESVYWYYGTKTDKHAELLENNFHVSDTMPKNFATIPEKSFIVLDDMMESAKDSQVVTRLFTQQAHHRKYFVIYSTQNMFYQSREARTRSLNCQYMVLFKNPRDKVQVRTLGMQMYPNKAHYLENIFEDATQDAHSYLFIDLHQDTSELVRLRARVLPHGAPMVAYVDKQLYNDDGCIL